MKIWVITKNILILLSIFAILLYSAILFLLPMLLNKKDYSSFLTDVVVKQTGLVLIIDKYNLSVAPNLDIELKSDIVKLFYPDKKQILDVKNLHVGVSPFALIKKELKINKIQASELQFSTKLLKSGKTTLWEYLEKNTNIADSTFYFSNSVPKIKIQKYLVKIKNEESGEIFKVVGKNFDISQHVDYKYFNLKLGGEFYCNDKLYLSYHSKFQVPKILLRDFHTKVFDVNFDSLIKQNFSATLNSDLKINVSNDKFSYVSGFVNIDNFVLNLKGYKLPPSYFHIVADKGYANLVSNLYLNKLDYADIKAKIRILKPFFLELECKCPRADLHSFQNIIIPLFDILKIKNNLIDFNIEGFVSANFKLNTDFKTIKSNGKLLVKNLLMNHKTLPFVVSNANADIDFSNNLITIKQSDLFINNQPVKISGYIKQDSTCSIIANAKNLDLKNIAKAFPSIFNKISSNFSITSGVLNLSAKLNGKLLDAVPIVDLNISNLNLYNKYYDFAVFASNMKAQVNADLTKYNGKLLFKSVSIVPKALSNSINKLYSDSLELSFDNKDVHLSSAKFSTGSAFFTVSGDIKNYITTPDIHFVSSGTIATGFLKDFIHTNLPLYNKGYLPFRFTLKGKDPSYNANIQVLANPNNYISPFLIKNIEKTNSLTNIQFCWNKNNLTINDLSLYYADSINSLKNEISLSKLRKIFAVKGKINNINSNNPDFDNVKVQANESLRVHIGGPCSVFANISGELALNGLVYKPLITGMLNISNVSIPTYKINISSVYANLLKNKINLKFNNLSSTDFALSANLVLPVDFLTTKVVSNISLSADYLDLDRLLSLTLLLPQAKYAPGVDFPYSVSSGTLSIKAFKTGNIKAQNIVSDFNVNKNILNLYNLTALAYGGNVVGKIKYNFPYSAIEANIQGRGLNSANLAFDIMPKEHQISGNLNFDADIKTCCSTPNSQLEALSGNVDVVIKNGHLGQLGRFEHFLYAQNLLSQRFINASLNSAKQAISPKNTGQITYLKGVLRLKNGNLYFSPVLTSGPNMSMYITGSLGLKNNFADLVILGKISSDVSSSLGVLGNMTIKGLLDEHTKYGQTVARLFNFFNSELPEVDISKIPSLSPDLKYLTKNFRVLISGNASHVSSVKSFTWVNPIGTKNSLLLKDSKNNLGAAQSDNVLVSPNTSLSDNQYINTSTNTYSEENNSTPNFLDNIPDTFD